MAIRLKTRSEARVFKSDAPWVFENLLPRCKEWQAIVLFRDVLIPFHENRVASTLNFNLSLEFFTFLALIGAFPDTDCGTDYAFKMSGIICSE